MAENKAARVIIVLKEGDKGLEAFAKMMTEMGGHLNPVVGDNQVTIPVEVCASKGIKEFISSVRVTLPNGEYVSIPQDGIEIITSTEIEPGTVLFKNRAA